MSSSGPPHESYDTDSKKVVTFAMGLQTIDQSIIKNVGVDLTQQALINHLGDFIESRSMTFDLVRLPDIAVGLSRWMDKKTITTSYPRYAGESWPVPPGHWMVMKTPEKECLIPDDTVVVFNDCAIDVSMSDGSGKLYIIIYAKQGDTENVLREICDSIKNHGVMKGSVISKGALIERANTSMDDFFVNDTTLRKIEKHLLNLFDGKRKQAFHRAGMPFKRGILLIGKPGTGKTTLGKIVESLNPGITTMWLEPEQLGESLTACMKLARELAPTIVYMEDLDGCGITRDLVTGNPFLTKLLGEMDGRESNEGIVFIGSSNRPDDLDSALIRPGRFDIVIELDLPDRKIRAALLSKLLKNVSLSSDVTVEDVLPFTEGRTQAEIEELVRSAILDVLYEGKRKLQKRHFGNIVEEKRKMGFGQ